MKRFLKLLLILASLQSQSLLADTAPQSGEDNSGSEQSASADPGGDDKSGNDKDKSGGDNKDTPTEEEEPDCE